jgi:hypothetical protein
MPKHRYDEEEDVSRHAGSDPKACLEMEERNGWELKRIEELPETDNQVLEVDCVFEGQTEFPKSHYETDREHKADA